MPVSKVVVCNAALARLGQDVRITAMSDQSKHAKVLNAAWDRVLDYVLTDGVWPFAVREAALALKPDAANGWAFGYDLPDDCLTALAVSDAGSIRAYRHAVLSGAVNGPEFEVRYGDDGSVVLTDTGAAWLLYVARVDDTARYPPLFVEALSCRLALDIAPVVAAELGIRMGEQLEARYIAARMRAQAHAFNESSERMHTESLTLASRL